MSLYEVAKDAVKIAQKADNIELVQKILDIQEAALDMQEKIQTKNEIIEKLNKQNEELRLKLETKGEYILDKSVYWRHDDKDRMQPYCPTCYAKNKIMPLQKTWDGEQKNHSRWHCPDKSCGSSFNPWDFNEERIVSYDSENTGLFDLNTPY